MCILLIDDERYIRDVTRIMLTQAGYEVLEAAGGEEGLMLFQSGAVDVVLCDLFMPDIDGCAITNRG